jgi:transposase
VGSRCRIVYDKFHIMQHANDAVDEVRRAEFFRKGRKMRDVIKGKKWLLLSRWKNLAPRSARRAEPAVPVEPAGVQSLPAQRESGKLWDYRYEGAMLNYLGSGWINCGGSACPRFRNSPRCCSSTSTAF